MTFWAHGQGARIVGHRGGRGPGWPMENTLEAFERARREGARAIELDVRLARDGIVVCHDSTLARVTGGREAGAVAEMTASDLARWDVPTLADVLAWGAANGIAVNVEIKRDVRHRTVLAARVGTLVRSSRADVLVSSFDPWILVAVAPFARRVPLALLVSARHAAWFDRVVGRLPQKLFHAVHLEDAMVTASRARVLGSRRVALGVYTVNDRARAVELSSAGAAWVISDAPGVVGEAIGDVGARGIPSVAP